MVASSEHMICNWFISLDTVLVTLPQLIIFCFCCFSPRLAKCNWKREVCRCSLDLYPWQPPQGEYMRHVDILHLYSLHYQFKNQFCSPGTCGGFCKERLPHPAGETNGREYLVVLKNKVWINEVQEVSILCFPHTSYDVTADHPWRLHGHCGGLPQEWCDAVSGSRSPLWPHHPQDKGIFSFTIFLF